MPITQTVNGLIVNETLDTSADYNTWSFSCSDYYYGGGRTLDTTNHAAGFAASFYDQASFDSCYFSKTLNLGTGTGRYAQLLVTSAGNYPTPEPGAPCVPFQVGSSAIIPSFTTPTDPYGPQGPFTLMGGTIPDALIGNQTCYLGMINGSNNGGGQCWMNNLTVCLNKYLTITGVTVGQKVSVYNSSATLVNSGTVTAGQTQVGVDVSTVQLPQSLYLVITASDGSSIVETTPLQTMCGGDVWAWTSPSAELGPVAGPSLSAFSSDFIIYAKNAPGPVKEALISLTLSYPSGAPVVGGILQFSTTVGTLSATSVKTNAQGFAAVSFESSQSGLAVVIVTTEGFIGVAAATAYIPIHVFAGMETPDSTRPFQVFIEGAEYAFTDGSYTRAADGVVGSFEVDIPAYLSTLVPLGLVSIYRFGVKEFAGVLTRIERTLSDNPTVKLKGSEAAWLLNARTIPLQAYTGTAGSILESLLADYPCGIIPGQISLPSTTINEFFISVQLLAGINSLMKTVTGEAYLGGTVALTQGQYRVNPNLTLDASASLGKVTSAVFAEATVSSGTYVLVSGSNVTEDISLIANSVHAKGNGITAVAQNPASILEYGLIESTDQQPAMIDQTTLDMIAEFDAVKDANAGLMVDLMVVDGYPAGTYGLYDFVAVNSPTLGLSGLYQVKQLTRSTLTSPYVTELQLGARIQEVWQLDEPIKNAANQLVGVLVAAGGTPTFPRALAFDAAAKASGTGSQTFSATLSHSQNVTILIFVNSGTFGVTGVTVGSTDATLLTENTGGEGFLFVYYLTRAAAGSETVTVTLTGGSSDEAGFVAVSIKNSTTNLIDANGVVAGASTTTPPSTVTIGNGTVGRMIAVGCSTLIATGPAVALDGQLVLAAAWSDSGMAVGLCLDNTGNGLTFNNSWSGGGFAASITVAVKP